MKNLQQHTGHQESSRFIRHTCLSCHSRESGNPGGQTPPKKDTGFRIKCGMTQNGWIHMNKNHARLNSTHRYEGLVNYIADKYDSAVEIGVGHFPDVAFALLDKGVRVTATDIIPFDYKGLKVAVDDITLPDLSLYDRINLIYSLRPPPELVFYMVKLAKTLSAVLIIKPLASEYPGGKLISHGNTTFFMWSYR